MWVFVKQTGFDGSYDEWQEASRVLGVLVLTLLVDSITWLAANCWVLNIHIYI